MGPLPSNSILYESIGFMSCCFHTLFTSQGAEPTGGSSSPCPILFGRVQDAIFPVRNMLHQFAGSPYYVVLLGCQTCIQGSSAWPCFLRRWHLAGQGSNKAALRHSQGLSWVGNASLEPKPLSRLWLRWDLNMNSSNEPPQLSYESPQLSACDLGLSC